MPSLRAFENRFRLFLFLEQLVTLNVTRRIGIFRGDNCVSSRVSKEKTMSRSERHMVYCVFLSSDRRSSSRSGPSSMVTTWGSSRDSSSTCSTDGCSRIHSSDSLGSRNHSKDSTGSHCSPHKVGKAGTHCSCRRAGIRYSRHKGTSNRKSIDRRSRYSNSRSSAPSLDVNPQPLGFPPQTAHRRLEHEAETNATPSN